MITSLYSMVEMHSSPISPTLSMKVQAIKNSHTVFKMDSVKELSSK